MLGVFVKLIIRFKIYNRCSFTKISHASIQMSTSIHINLIHCLGLPIVLICSSLHTHTHTHTHTLLSEANYTEKPIKQMCIVFHLHVNF